MPEEGLGSHFLHPLHCHLRGKYIRKPHEILYGIHAPAIKPQGMHSYIVLHCGRYRRCATWIHDVCEPVESAVVRMWPI